MTFKQALKNLCEEHEVKLSAGFVKDGSGGIRCVMKAFKKVDGKMVEQEIPPMGPKQVTEWI